MSANVSSNVDLTAWNAEIQGLAQSGALASAVQAVYGASTDPVGLNAFIESLSRGDSGALPAVSVLDADTMQGHPGAYAAETDTIYINATILGSQPILIEVLTHELGHFIADQFYTGNEAHASAQNLTHQLLAKNYSLLLTGHEEGADAEHPPGELVLPGTESTTEVKWFDTNLHIEWAKQKLPMLNAQAFTIFERAQNDSDAFTIMSA